MAETQIPVLDFSDLDLEEGSEGWKAMSKKLRETCEEYGCFQVVYSKIPTHLYEEMFMALKSLFDLPEETKKKNLNTKAYGGYIGKSEEKLLYENLGIINAPLLPDAKAFADLMWPDGNPEVYRIFNSMSAKMLELQLLITKMIFESFGLGKYYASYEGSIYTIFRFMKYDAPPPSHDSSRGLGPHKDKTITTILRSEVEGLQVLSKDDNWVKVQPLPRSFVEILGDMLKVLKNGKLEGTKHQVEMSGNKERYSNGLFAVFNEGVVVEVPNELVDKDHPPLFRPFNNTDFLNYLSSNYNDDGLEVYAGV